MFNRLRLISLFGVLVVLIFSPLSRAEAPATMNQQRLQVSQGDIIVKQNQGGTWDAIKILQVDTFPDGSSTAHCLSYQSTPLKPTTASLPMLAVRIWHETGLIAHLS